jgi:hypothetical protein
MPVTTPTQGQSILVDTPEDQEKTAAAMQQHTPGSDLVTWIIDKVEKWENHRDSGYKKKWAEYWRMWRGQWDPDDKNRGSERSRLIAPALSQAVEMTVSELEEAMFSRDVWFDVADDIADEDKVDALKARDFLLEDLELVNAQDQISEAILNASLFGTGIVKISPYVGRADQPRRGTDYSIKAEGHERVFVTVESIRPDEFIPDPAGRSIDEMLGCAHRMANRPMHVILEKISQGVYREDALLGLAPQQRSKNSDVDDTTDPQSMIGSTDSEQVDVVEWHGKVPAKLLAKINRDPRADVLEDVILAEQEMEAGDGPLVEAIVTIANGSVLLRAIPNPFVMKDRSIIAFQFEKVPGRFWGRGVAEKGYNPQKALDAEIRARIDALAFVSAPMLGVDSGRMPKGFKMEIKPGKIWVTQGAPSEVLSPVAIGQVDPNTFNQASEMERMVQMGTGAFDTASALKQQSQSGSNSLSSNSMLMGAFVKRSKRSIRNVDRNLMQPLIKKLMWRYMQFDPERYPTDYEFAVKATMGIMAREVEAAQMTQLMGMLPEEAKSVGLVIAQGIIENTAFANKAQVIQAINKAMEPPPPEVIEQQKALADMQLQATMAEAQSFLIGNQKTMAEIRKLLAEAEATVRKGELEDDKLLQEHMKIKLMSEELDQFAEQNKIASKRLDLQYKQLELKTQEVKAKKSESKK